MTWVVPPVSYAPSKAVCDILNNAVCASPTVTIRRDVNLFRGLVKAAGAQSNNQIPDQAIFVLSTGGEPPQTNSGSPETLTIRSVVNVYIRGARNGFTDGENLARFVWRQLHHNVPARPYYELECAEGEPSFIDLDDTEHPRWLITVRITREE